MWLAKAACFEVSSEVCVNVSGEGDAGPSSEIVWSQIHPGELPYNGSAVRTFLGLSYPAGTHWTPYRTVCRHLLTSLPASASFLRRAPSGVQGKLSL